MAVVLALLAAVAFAGGTVLQQKGAMEAPGGDVGFLVQIVRQRVWLAGALLQASGWILQAAALDRGTMLVVQAICTLSLVIALPLGVRLTGQHVGQREIAGAIAVVVGIVLFLSAGAPSGGVATPGAAAWWAAAIATAVLVILVGSVARRQRGAPRAAMFGIAAGVCFALQAAVTKVFVGELGQGVAHLLATWSTYALIATALVGFVLQQSALRTGVLAPAMASSNASTLVFSVVFGIWIFDESLDHGGAVAAAAWVGLAAAVVGVALLANQEPVAA